ncbi:MAG: cupin domain-containing protein [Deltaproteobacteria bacterium]|nr:cupin domain-containing protein [Deltaproteobacteria bacterium]
MFNQTNDEGFQEPFPGVRLKTIAHGGKTLMAEFRLTKGHELPEHSHPHEQTGYLVSGRIVLIVEGRRFDAEPGASWCIPGDAVHSAEILEDSVAIEVFSPVREDYLP